MNRWMFIVLLILCISCGSQTSPVTPTPVATPQPAPTPVIKTFTYQVSSQGHGGATEFRRNGKEFLNSFGYPMIGTRGFNFLLVNPTTGELIDGQVHNFDTWSASLFSIPFLGHDIWQEMIEHIQNIPANTLVLVGVGDEAGITFGATGGCDNSTGPAPGNSCCVHLIASRPQQGTANLKQLGSALIDNYCYRNSWSMVAIKGLGKQDESLQVTGPAVSNYTLTLP